MRLGIIQNLSRWVGRFARQEDGATATEYAVMFALILMTCIGAVQAYGGSVQGMFVSIQTTLFAG